MPTLADHCQSLFPSRIRQRGNRYYENGRVTISHFDEDEGYVLADVAGTEPYDVTVEWDDAGHVEMACSCPYAEERFCKHLWATLRAIDALGLATEVTERRRIHPALIPHDLDSWPEALEEPFWEDDPDDDWDDKDDTELNEAIQGWWEQQVRNRRLQVSPGRTVARPATLAPMARDGGFPESDSFDVRQSLLFLRTGLLFLADRIVRFEPPAAFPWLVSLRERVEIPHDSIDEALAELLSLGDLPEVRLPQSIDWSTSVGTPQTVLTLGDPHPDGTLRARISFLYDGVDVALHDTRRQLADPDRRALVLRDHDAEARWVRSLSDTRLAPEAGPLEAESGRELRLDPAHLVEEVEKLLDAGWQIRAMGRKVRKSGKFELSVTSGVDWFDLAGAMDFGGGQAAPLPSLLAAQPGVEVDEVFAAVRERLSSFESLEPRATPEGFQGELRGYQEVGLAWLELLADLRLGGCLADDMGLGGTVQVLAHLWRRKPEDPSEDLPSLLVVPRSLIYNWETESQRFTPDLSVLRYHGPQRKELRDRLAEHDLVVTTYGTMRRDIGILREQQFDVAVLDEAQAIKNPASQTAKASRLLQARQASVGLNLTAAGYVFLLDPWWNPAVESQAIDRAHRIGQDQPVFAYRLIARDTIEEKILKLQEEKKALADAVVARDGRMLKQLTVQDLELLLG